MKKRILTVTLLAGVLASGVLGCGTKTEKVSEDVGSAVENTKEATERTADDSANTGGGEKKVFRLGVLGQEGSEVMEVATLAYKKGYIEEEFDKIGYSLEVTAFAGAGPEMNEALAAGAVDALIYGDFPAFVSKSNGIDTTIIGTVNWKQQYGILVTSDDIKEPKDLEGKKVVVPQGTVSQYFWEQYVKENDLDSSSIEIINSIDGASLLQTGEADGYEINLYQLKYMESLGLGTVFDDGGDMQNGTTSYVFEVLTSLLKEDPEIGVAFNKAIIRAYNDAVANPQELYDAEATETIPADIMATNYAFDTSLWYLSPEITDEAREYYDSLNEWLYEKGLIAEKLDLDTFIDTSYYEKAIEELGEEN